MSSLDFSISVPASIAGFGVIVAVAAILWYQIKKRRLAGWSKAKGRVESYKAIPDEGNGFYYSPTVVFPDSFGHDVRFHVDARWNRKVYDEGAEIPVLFSPSNPQSAVIDRWAESYLEVIVLYILSGFLISGGIGMAIFSTSLNEDDGQPHGGTNLAKPRWFIVTLGKSAP